MAMTDQRAVFGSSVFTDDDQTQLERKLADAERKLAEVEKLCKEYSLVPRDHILDVLKK